MSFTKCVMFILHVQAVHKCSATRNREYLSNVLSDWLSQVLNYYQSYPHTHSLVTCTCTPQDTCVSRAGKENFESFHYQDLSYTHTDSITARTHRVLARCYISGAVECTNIHWGHPTVYGGVLDSGTLFLQ